MLSLSRSNSFRTWPGVRNQQNGEASGVRKGDAGSGDGEKHPTPSATPGQALRQALSTSQRPPRGGVLLPLPLPPQTRTLGCREMRSCALRSGPWGPVSFWEESPWCLKRKLGSENRCRVIRATSPTCSRHLVTSRGSALPGPRQVEEAARTPHGFSFASSSHPDQKPSKVFMVLNKWIQAPLGSQGCFRVL